MTLFLDRHSLTDVTAADVASAHELDLGAQHAYGVRYLTYWYDDRTGRIFCLAEGPDRQSVEEVHRKAHGLVAEEIIEVGEEPLNAFLGALPDHPPGEAYVDSALRAILFTDLCGSTEQTQRLGDDGHMVLLREHDGTVRHALSKAGGREVKHTTGSWRRSLRLPPPSAVPSRSNIGSCAATWTPSNRSIFVWASVPASP